MKFTEQLSWLKNLNITQRLLISVGVAVMVMIILPSGISIYTRIICIWDSGIIFFLCLSLFMMLHLTPEKIRLSARQEREGRLPLLIFTTGASLSSIFAISFMLNDAKQAKSLVFVHIAMAFLTIILSWLLVHTLFASRYAYLYYRQDVNDNDDDDQSQDRLNFPNDTIPDYWDFLYYSLTVGMTSQVSDVTISSTALRRLTLIHGVISFFFNTSIIAMSINIIASLSSSN